MRLRAVLVVLLPLVLSLGQPEIRTWTGRVAVVGHDPFTELALTEDNGRRWRLQGEPVKSMWKSAQLQRVTVAGHPQGTDAIVVASWALVDEARP